jgi:hypothetical protein
MGDHYVHSTKVYLPVKVDSDPGIFDMKLMFLETLLILLMGMRIFFESMLNSTENYIYLTCITVKNETIWM